MVKRIVWTSRVDIYKLVFFVLAIMIVNGCKSYYYNGYEVIHNSRIIKNDLVTSSEQNISVTGKIRQLKKPINASLLFKNKDTIIMVKSIEGIFECLLPDGIYGLIIKSNQEPYCFKVIDPVEFELKEGEHRNIEIQLDASQEKNEIVFKSKKALEKYSEWEKFNSECNPE
ncbi:hypothetical protein [Flagellimonas onchidii]|uniref:hypothetical protein n=1 Tax=Flagellimonas onchidii TaxID=2562684 RepID=UPI0010A66826|nr:hypothetical protein [Allomuricauda onchidii]